jgi:hypothetical protein
MSGWASPNGRWVFDIDNFCARQRWTSGPERVMWHKRGNAVTLMWGNVGNGKGDKDMVIIPVRTGALFCQYPQQLVMNR